MRIIARSPLYVIKEVSRNADEENAGYRYAVFTREEAAYGALGYPEFQCETFEECLEVIQESVSRGAYITTSKEYRDRYREWLQK